MIPAVWAPRADTVRLALPTGPEAMTQGNDGWWHGTADLPPGTDYGFLLDDDATPLPDPRSRWQPGGVHGLSRTFDPTTFSWSDDSWPGRPLADGVIYELHVGTFTPEGTFDAAIDRLDHLLALGVTFVELLPVNAVNGVHNWGYDGVLWYAVHEPYGGPSGYQRFIDACHARGLAVIQDVVYNHLGPSGNYLPRFGPYLDDSTANTWGSTINLDGDESAEVRRYVIDNAVMWVDEYHVDGLRLDAVHALRDTSHPHLLAQLSERIDRLSADLSRPITLIAESDLNDPIMITPRSEGGYGLTAQWDDDYHHAAHVALTGETTGYYADFDSLAALGKTAGHGFFHDGTWSSFRGRQHGVPIDPSVPLWRLVTYTQDHDQVGNRATGDRLSATLDAGGIQIAAVLTMLTPFTPMIFMGEEWAASTPWQFFTSHPEPELGTATAEGRIAEFAAMGWDPASVPDPQDPRTFQASKLDWSEVHEARHRSVLDLYRRLARLRADEAAFRDDDFASVTSAWDEHERWFRLDRRGLSIVINFSDQPRTVPLTQSTEVVLATGEAEIVHDGVVLEARSAAVVRVATTD